MPLFLPYYRSESPPERPPTQAEVMCAGSLKAIWEGDYALALRYLERLFFRTGFSQEPLFFRRRLLAKVWRAMRAHHTLALSGSSQASLNEERKAAALERSHKKYRGLLDRTSEDRRLDLVTIQARAIGMDQAAKLIPLLLDPKNDLIADEARFQKLAEMFS